MSALVSYQLRTVTDDGREIPMHGPTRQAVYKCADVDELLQRISARLNGHGFAMATEVKQLITAFRRDHS